LYKSPEHHPRVSPAELAHIRSDPPDQQVKVPLSQVLPHRQAWAFTVAKFMTDPIWWLYLFWIPDFFSRTYGLDRRDRPPFSSTWWRASAASAAGGSRLADQAGLERQRGPGRCCSSPRGGAHRVRVEGATWLATALVAWPAAPGWSANVFDRLRHFPAAPSAPSGFGGMAGPSAACSSPS
jgi:ACS family hexuronate transporter-like MFS transporter